MMRTGLVTVIFLALLLVGCVVYPGIGARFIAPQTVLQAFLHFEPLWSHIRVMSLFIFGQLKLCH